MRRRFPFQTTTKVSEFVAAHDAEFIKPHQWTYHDSPVDCDLNVRTLQRSSRVTTKGDGTNGYIVALMTATNNCRWNGFELDSGRTAAWFVRFDEGSVYAGDTARDLRGETAYILLARTGARRGSDEWILKDKWRLGACGHHRTGPDSVAVRPTTTVCDPTRAPGGDDSSEPEPTVMRPPTQLMTARIAGWFYCGGDCCYGRSILD